MAESKLNKFLDDLDKKILECSICLKRIQEPKSLSCLHSFCKDCLQTWVDEKGSLTCPICQKLYPIPEGGIRNLQPNTFLNNLLEIFDQVEKGEGMECSICRKGKQTDCYCIECRLYLCSSCGDYHLKFPGSAKHKLYSKAEITAMSPQQLSALQPPQCSQHNEDLKFFCEDCNVPICRDCAITDHNVGKGNHSTCDISEPFNAFRETAEKLKESANIYKNKIEDGLKKVLENASQLDERKETSLKDIENSCEALIKSIKDKEVEMKNEVERLYGEKKEVSETQMVELQTTIADVNTKLNFLDQLLKSDKATALKSGDKVIKAMTDRINDLPTVDPIDNGEINYVDKELECTLKQCDIGIVDTKKTADWWKICSVEEMSNEGKTLIFFIQKNDVDAPEINVDQAKATLTLPNNEINIANVQKHEDGSFIVKVDYTVGLLGDYVINVSINNKAIRESPKRVYYMLYTGTYYLYDCDTELIITLK